MVALLNLYKVEDPEEVARLLEWTNQAKASSWWEPYGDDVTESAALVLSLEAEARLVRTFSHSAFNGLVQTREYATAVLSTFRHSEETLARLVDLCMERKRVLRRPYPLQIELIIAEEALYRPLAHRSVMRGQLEELLHAAGSPDTPIDVRVLPMTSTGRIPNAIFTIFYPHDEADWKTVNEEGNITSQWFEAADQVSAFETIWGELVDRSLDNTASHVAIAKALREIY